jgi:ElaA protein
MKTFVIKKFDELSGREVYEILKARSAVFTMEQNIHYMDMDDVDYRSVHFAEVDDDGHVIAYLRMFAADDAEAVNVGRVLVLARGQGNGRELMNLAIDYATQKGYRCIFCNAQKQTIAFYERCGFETISEEFIEAGIPHVRMRRELV